MEKREIRKQVFSARKELTQNELEQKSRVICEKIIRTDAFAKADSVYVYRIAKARCPQSI